MKPDQLDKINKSKKRKGRGRGSGKGKTSGRGTKGQKARSGSKLPRGFEGGQTPLKKRLPKRGGFSRGWVNKPEIVNLNQINDAYEKGETVSPKTLAEKGLIENANSEVKILATGELDEKLEFKNCQFSKAAKKQTSK